MQLFHGDCLEQIKNVPDKSVDLVLTDPPYGIDFQSCRRKDADKRFKKIKNDKKPFVEFIEELPRVVKDSGAVVIFARWDVQQFFMDEMKRCGMKPKGCLIWHKGAGGMGDIKGAWAMDYETIPYWTAKEFKFNHGRPGTSVIKSMKITPTKLTHPNEKPVDLLRYIIDEMSPKGGTVLDCFAGSGAVGVACVKSGRQFIGIELDEKYFKAAKTRIEKTYVEPSMMDMIDAGE